MYVQHMKILMLMYLSVPIFIISYFVFKLIRKELEYTHLYFLQYYNFASVVTTNSVLLPC